MTTRRVWATAACAAMALALTACGSGSTGAATDGPTGTPIKIGLAVSKSGFNSEQAGPAAEAAQAWAQWVNAQGGIDGHPVEVLDRDSAGTPATGQAVVKELVEQENVSAIMLADVSIEAGVADYLKSRNIAVLESQGYDANTWSTVPNYFTTSTTDTAMQAAYATSAAAAGAKTISVAACAEAPTCANAGTVVEQLSPSLGLTDNGMVKVSASQPSFTAECLSFQEKGTQFIAMALAFAGTGTRMAADCLQQGYTGKFGVNSGSVITSLLDEVPSAQYQGALNSFPWWTDDAPVRQYRDALDEYAPDLDAGSSWLTGTWAGLEMFRKAVTGKATGGLTTQQVLDAYATVKDENLGGLLPMAVTYTAGQPAPKIPCYWLYSYTSGAGDPTSAQQGRNGNGLTTGLASSCYDGPGV